MLGVTVRNARRLAELDSGYNVGAESLDGRNLTLRAATLPFVRVAIAASLLALWLLRRRSGAGPLRLSTALLTLASLLSVPPPRLRAAVRGGGVRRARSAGREASVRPSPERRDTHLGHPLEV